VAVLSFISIMDIAQKAKDAGDALGFPEGVVKNNYRNGYFDGYTQALKDEAERLDEQRIRALITLGIREHLVVENVPGIAYAVDKIYAHLFKKN
jgi:hypothetical protein